MVSRHRTSSVRRLLQLLFLCSFVCSLCLGHLPFTYWQERLGEAVTRIQTVTKNNNNHSLMVTSAHTKQYLPTSINRYRKGDLQDEIQGEESALTIYKQKINNKKKINTSAIFLIENLAKVYQEMGETEEAIAYWEEAITYYRQAKNWLHMGQILLQQAQAYNNLGKTTKAIIVASRALRIAHAYNDNALEAAALTSRGEAYRLEGDYKQAIADLQSSIKIAQGVHNWTYRASALNKLATTYISLAHVNYGRANSAIAVGDNDEADILKKQAWQYDLQALEYFQKSLNIARDRNDKLGEIRSLINSIPPANRTNKLYLTKANLQLALLLLKDLPNSHQKVDAAIELAQLVQSVSSSTNFSLTSCPLPEGNSQALDLLNQAVTTAERLEDYRALSFAYGNLGHIYECRQDYEQALNLTQQAQQAAEKGLNAQDSLYLWQWQAGRILKKQNQLDQAIAAYESSVATLENFRDQIVIANPDLQLDPCDAIENIYRELIALKLSLDDVLTSSGRISNRSQNLNSILTTIDALKLAELHNYFGKNSITKKYNPAKVNLIDTHKDTAVFSSFILEDRTAIIVSLPNGEIKLKWIKLNSQSLKEEINKFRRGLERRSDIIYNRSHSQRLYDWIIRPFADDLESLQIKTLVFIQDGILRTVPMGTLHDGKQFLIQNYAIANTPSLSLTDSSIHKRDNLRALVVGLTKDAIVDGRKFAALTNVEEEINHVLGLIPASKLLLNENFTRDRLQTELRRITYPIIHIATHAEFSFVPEETFLVTGDNNKLTITDLYSIINNNENININVDLLALTACETATGDDRAALGMANVAVMAGVKSTLASLWSINDATTVSLVTKFYEYWRDRELSKAEALQKAQQELIALGKKYAHPYYWAPFVILGNWL